ncbi:MAG: response regulator, partial [Paenibacillaceae bacterium]|nr:response regulator [Paenibacillaceae bacterium]
MYDVLIVDDEPAAIKSLVYSLDWEKHGFEIAAEAYDGEMALQLLDSHSFSLIITDIRMPGMDGLRFIANVRKASDVPILIVSGYEDFEYARQGMKLNVTDYLLKPVEAQELGAKLGQIRLAIEEKALLHSRLYHGVPVVRDRLLRQWAHGYTEDAQLLRSFDFAVSEDDLAKYAVLLAEIERHDATISYLPDKTLKLNRFAARNVIEELCAGIGYVFEESDLRCGVVLTGGEQEMTEAALLDFAGNMQDRVRQYARVNVTIAVGGAVASFRELVYSYVSAVRALDGCSGSRCGAVVAGEGFSWSKEQRVQKLIEEVKLKVQEQYASNMNLRLMAGQVFLHPSYLGQLFKQHLGASFNQYLL